MLLLALVVVDLIVTNARVWTGVPARPAAEAVAVAGERILAVGADTEIAALAGPGTRIIDAGGATVLPGLIDAHCHTGFRKVEYPPLFLPTVRTRKELLARLARYAAGVPPGTWIGGFGWSGPPVSRADLDRVSLGRPVWLLNADGGSGMANSAAVRAAGSDSPDAIERAKIEPTRERDDRAFDAWMAYGASEGITTGHDCGISWEDFHILERNRGRMKLRLRSALPLNAVERQLAYIERHGRGDSWLRWDAVKGFPKRDDPMQRRLALAHQAGLAIRVHTSGEAAIGSLIDLVEKLQLGGVRFRIEHCFLVSQADAERMARLGVIGSLQPGLAMPFRNDAARFHGELPSRRLLDAGAAVAFGTDGGPSALGGIALAVGMGAATLDEALAACTRDAAYAAFDEKELGTIEPGKLADIVVLNQPLTIYTLRDVRVRITIAGGRITYASGEGR